ncbi:MAG: hypothetical protein AAGF73_04485 [Actinomycetota bacterium]
MRTGKFGVVAAVLFAAACGADTAPDDALGAATTEAQPGTTSPTVATIPASTTEPGRAPESSIEPPEDLGSLPFGLTRCGPVTPIPADPDFYRDHPVYFGGDQPLDEVRVWAADQPAFEQLWIDQAHNGWLALGFSEGAAERQAELEQLFPGAGVVAVEIPYTTADLDALLAEVFAIQAAMGNDRGGSAQPWLGRVSVWGGVLDAESLEPFAEFAGTPVCFEGIDPEDAVADGPQPEGGEGWRLLTVNRGGPTYRTGVATTQGQYDALWSDLELTGTPPTVDFDSEIVIWFGAVYGSNCPIRLDDVVTAPGLVHGDFVVPGNPPACNDDANGESYLVAVERSALPTEPFAIQLGPEDPPGGAPLERTLIAVDLSTPGSSALDGQIGPDPARLDESFGSAVPNR